MLRNNKTIIVEIETGRSYLHSTFIIENFHFAPDRKVYINVNIPPPTNLALNLPTVLKIYCPFTCFFTLRTLFQVTLDIIFPSFWYIGIAGILTLDIWGFFDCHMSNDFLINWSTRIIIFFINTNVDFIVFRAHQARICIEIFFSFFFFFFLLRCTVFFVFFLSLCERFWT